MQRMHPIYTYSLTWSREMTLGKKSLAMQVQRTLLEEISRVQTIVAMELDLDQPKNEATRHDLQISYHAIYLSIYLSISLLSTERGSASRQITMHASR
jgi:hypothetical protein